MERQIHWLSQHPTHYKDALFHSLQRANLPVVVHYATATLSNYPWKKKARREYPHRFERRRIGLDWKLLQIACSGKRTVLIIEGWRRPFYLLIFLAARLRRTPFVVYSDTPVVHGRNKNPLIRFIRKRLVGFILAGAKNILTWGREARSVFQKMGVPGKKILQIPYMLEWKNYSSKVFRRTPPIEIFSSGRLVNAHKGYDLGLRALAILAKEPRVPHFIWSIAGTGPDEGALRALSRDLGISQRIRFLGWVETKDLPAIFKHADIFLHPSHFDPYGVAVLEAIASGLALIVSDAAGISGDLLKNGNNALIHRDGDLADLTERLRTILISPQTRRQLSQGAIRTSRKFADWEKQAVSTVKKLLNSG